MGTPTLIRVSELYGETLTDITISSSNWLSFLTCAGNNYKYSFSAQVLIYAHKPNAVACATMKDWNNRYKRWIKKNTKAIKLIDDTGITPKIKLVFDVSDTYSYFYPKVKLWKYERKYNNEIIEKLKKNYGDYIENDTDIGNAIILIVNNIVENSLDEYFENIISNSSDSFFELLDEEMAREKISRILKNSISYMVMTRCNIDPFNYFEEDDFLDIREFNSYAIVSILGVITSENSKIIIQDIREINEQLKENEENQKRTFVENFKNHYNLEKEERRIENENNLHETRGLLSSEHSFNKSATTELEQIWQSKTGISERTQERRVHDSTYERKTLQSLKGDTRNSNEERKADDKARNEETEHNRRIESKESTNVGGTYEQHQDDSTGTNNAGTNLYLGVYNEDNKIGYVVTDHKLNQILAQIVQLKVANGDVIKYFESEKDVTKRANYLKNNFTNAYTEKTINNIRYGYKAFNNGLLSWKGSFLDRTAETLTSWEDLTFHYDSMILLNQLKDKTNNFLQNDDQINLLNGNEVIPELEFTDEFINKVLLNESIETKYRIYEKLQSSLSRKDKEDFLKVEYAGSSGYSGASYTIKGSGIGITNTFKGMTLYRGYFEDEIKITLKWNEVVKRVEELIKTDKYLNDFQKNEYTNFQNPKNIESSLIENINLLEDEQGVIDSIEDKQQDEYEYHLGDTVYIGTDEYEIISIENDKVILYDPIFPIVNKEMKYNEFDKKIRENNANEHLKNNSFNKWLDTFIKEKGIDLEDTFTVERNGNLRIFEIGNIVENIKATSREEQNGIKDMIVKIDFANGDVIDYFKHLSNALIDHYELENNSKEQENTVESSKESREKNFVEERSVDSHSNIPEKINYKIINDDLGVGTPNERIENNINAIRLLKKCEEENRYATSEEQEILAKYVGWGGLAQVFKEEDKYYNELKLLLDEDEYESAKDSTLTAFYTPPIVIRSIYKAIENMGFKNGNILEPSCRYWKFFWNVAR